MSSNKRFSVLILFSLLLLVILDSADLTNLSSCPSHCGGIEIPYPFGIGKGCYLEKWYEVECVNTSASGKLIPFLSVINKEVVNVSLPSNLGLGSFTVPYGSVRIKNRITSKGCSSYGEEELGSLLNLTGIPYYVTLSNTLVGVGCNNSASLTNVEPLAVGCKSSCRTTYRTPTKNYLACINEYSLESCHRTSSMDERSCNGIRCCKAKMHGMFQQIVGVRIDDPTTTGGCNVAFLTDQANLVSNGTDPQRLHAKGYDTVELGWFIHTTNPSFVNSSGCYDWKVYKNQRSSSNRINCVCDYNSNLSYARCACTSDYKGNPYLRGGCTDINECQGQNVCGGIGTCVNLQGEFRCVYKDRPSSSILLIFTYHPLLTLGIGSIGSLIFISGMFWLYKFIRKQMRLRQKKKFIRNKGLLLQQQLNPTEGNVEKTQVFSSKELVKATENFSKNRILGEGGQGTVYKGMLVDGRIVAVKKSKIVEEDQLEEFINEVVILSQINHRNIVKLLGCCLETDVPVLVYEFIPNGNLFELLHDEFDDNTIATWEVRLRIAIDVAGALSYMHSSASSQIYHRDVKSTNIMLDEKYRAKVSDFGTSRSVTEDHTHLTTLVSGTAGYLDPEYHQSSRFTDKSDVYSFGVVLAELMKKSRFLTCGLKKTEH